MKSQLSAADLEGSQVEPNGVITKNGKPVGVMVEDKPVVGYNTPSRKLELFSKTLADWKWPEFALPEYYRSHIHRSAQRSFRRAYQRKTSIRSTLPVVDWPKDAHGEVYTLLPIFRLPNLIHTRSGNAKFLYEISHKNPLWVNPVDAKKLGVRTGDLMKVHTEIGYFVLHAWVTEGLTPGVVACSHHLGRWRINKEDQVERMSSAWVDLKEVGKGQWKMRQLESVAAVRQPRSRDQARLVERRRRASGHHISRSSRPDQRHALLASDGARGKGRRRRSLRGHLCGHESVLRRLPEMESPGATRPGPGGLRRPYGFRA